MLYNYNDSKNCLADNIQMNNNLTATELKQLVSFQTICGVSCRRFYLHCDCVLLAPPIHRTYALKKEAAAACCCYITNRQQQKKWLLNAHNNLRQRAVQSHYCSTKTNISSKRSCSATNIYTNTHS